MIKIEGSNLIKVSSEQDWSSTHSGGPGLRVRIEASYELENLLYIMKDLQYISRDLQKMHAEWSMMKKMIDTNPAVKANWEEFQTLLTLAKEPA